MAGNAVKYTRQFAVEHICAECGEPATKRLTFCYLNGRSNPASSMYGRDDCSFCSDADEFACDEHAPKIQRDAPDGMEWSGTFIKNASFAHMFAHWFSEDASAAVAELVEAARDYFIRYAQDEAAENGPHVTGCTQQQSDDAARLRAALAAFGESA